ncbi:hypothetical protein PLESTB_001341800 [Pleodorina starrii]|uniref:Uncharacterized protein n=1 Tax=Pleodorina starrii TaxID=330485 RepID=A0A9W6BTQ8_9CHLO|nr:hypothetical protein PLESTM_001457300 [Pleodorina starrii]GLC58286.1 hypothetical protein PLESTB_001341800 [Pleodorina starrii]GLC66362.1 hypothetical protein PLESTF_000416500 [Pleodorina starrii]
MLQGSLPVRARQAAHAPQIRCSRGRQLVCCVQARRSSSDPSPEILTAFFYGRALAITINKRLSEAVIDFVSDVSKAMAERPQRIAEFQEEVTALARKEMSSSGFLPESTTSGTAASGASSGRAGSAAGGSSGGAAAAGPVDPQAAIDDLRAEIAYARASLNEIRAKQRASAAQN